MQPTNGSGKRSTGDLLVLMIAGTVCFSVLAGGLTVAVLEAIDPDTDTDALVLAVRSTLTLLCGLLAGFLGGRAEAERGK